jgi:membrane protein
VASSTASGESSLPPPEPSRRERVRRWIEGRQGQLEAARGTSPTVGFAFDALSYDTDTGAPVLAAALAFRVFLFQVPYVCVFVIAAGYVADLTGREVESFFHGNGITHLTAQSVSGAAHLSGWTRATAFVVALYALFLSARSMVKVLTIVHALVWDVPRAKLASATRAALGFIGLITALVALSLGAVWIREHFALAGVAALLVYTIAPFVVWWYASTWLPHRDCPLIALAPGAALFAAGIELLHIATVVWFPHYLDSKSEVYGTLGVAIGLLLWAYLLGRLITLAAVLNAALWTRFGADSPHPLRIRRPNWWHIPLMEDWIDRAWTRLFGDFGTAADPPSPGDET